MSLESVTEKVRQKLAMSPSLNAKVKFDIVDLGFIFVDGTQNPPAIHNDDQEADLVLSTKPEIFEGLMNGTQDPNIAFMMGKIKIKGSMGLAMKLNSILEG
jgi:putative sterol carrier protein